MYNNDLIQRVCELTLTKDDVARNVSKLKYDTVHPFEKYYNLPTIKGAIEKFITNEWDDKTLSHWACMYSWILSGGFDKDITENLNSFEHFLRDVIIYDLDGISFFNAEYIEEDLKSMYESIKLFENYDHIWKSRDSWRAVYAMVGQYDEYNEEQWVVLINDSKREYMIMHTDHIENGYEDERFVFVTNVKFMELIERLGREGYDMLSCAEEYYYDEIKTLIY